MVRKSDDFWDYILDPPWGIYIQIGNGLDAHSEVPFNAYGFKWKLCWKEGCHLRTSAFTCRGRLVFAHLVQANTNSPLQSLATAEMMDLDFPTAESTLIFNDPLQGTYHWATVLGGDDVDALVLTPLNSANALERRALMSSSLSSIPSNKIPFLSFHTRSHIIAPNSRRSFHSLLYMDLLEDSTKN